MQHVIEYEQSYLGYYMSCHGEVPVEILSHKTKALFYPAINS